MKKHMKKIIIGGAILIVLGFGSVVIYHGINKNVPAPIEKATDTDAYVSNEDNAGNDVSTTALADNSKDKDTTTEKGKDDNKDASTEMVSNTGNTSSVKDDSANNGSSNISNGNTNGGTKPSTTESSKPNTTEATKPSTTESPKQNTTTEAPKPNNSNQNNNSNECDHKWDKVIKKTWIEPVTHQETVTTIVKPAGYETEYKLETHAFCRNCGDMGVMTTDSIADHVLSCQGGNSSYWFDDVEVPVQVWHEAITTTETKTVIDKEGYWKEEVTGYKCTKCGTTKSK